MLIGMAVGLAAVHSTLHVREHAEVGRFRAYSSPLLTSQSGRMETAVRDYGRATVARYYRR
jgi:hypothetical protein